MYFLPEVNAVVGPNMTVMVLLICKVLQISHLALPDLAPVLRQFYPEYKLQ